MPYLVNCRDCGFLRAAETTYDIGNGDLVRDQHESATLLMDEDKEGAEGIEKHTAIVQTLFPEDSEFHEDNFEDNFKNRITRGRAPRARDSYRSDRVVIVRDEYGNGDIRVYPLHHVPSFIESNRFSIIHSPDAYQGPEMHVNTVSPDNARSD